MEQTSEPYLKRKFSKASKMSTLSQFLHVTHHENVRVAAHLKAEYQKPEISDEQIKNINKIMESLCKIKIPINIFKMLLQNKDDTTDNVIPSRGTTGLDEYTKNDMTKFNGAENSSFKTAEDNYCNMK
jgi:hypothetical protein